ncbi:MarR family winged helix-turn-helix transcriptional regulator [Flaviflexus equikiangi]|uniref:MarR family transcriptional regulator n=1 Tax=Flaviflexus equikiangi TaxID=2758573 RepID=A0ABS2TJU2_9ACTO|nr:MarR family transcriptional regulator [Flaviflexus equikiangi]MBM9433559.1 MarR family transcriptional regulator [Flaviflexus equikiangi]
MARSDVEWLAADEQVAWRNYLRGSARLSAQIGNDLFEQHQLTLNKYEVLVRLSETDGWTMRMSDLADDLVHSRSRLTRTVASLEEEGYVVREACSGDGRGRNCRMTDSGFALLQELAPDHVGSVRTHLLDKIGHDDMVTLGRIMAKLLDEPTTAP